jgi:hypothetical protein
MQIYEITQSLQEGLLGDIGRGVFQGATGMEIPQSQASINKDAASASANLSAKGYGPAGTPPSAEWKDKLAQAKKDPAVKQYIAQLARGWAQEAKNIKTPPASTATNESAQNTPTSTTDTSTQSATVGGKRLDPNNPKDAQVLAALKAQGKLEENTAQTDPYQEAFVQWSDAQLASKDPVTYRAITMDDVRALPGLGAELAKALQAVVSARDTPQSTAAIAQYLELAVAGVQARSQQLKNKAPEVAIQALSGAQAKLGDIQQILSDVGVNPRALSAFGSKAKSKNVVTTGNDEADALLKQAGFSL